MINLLVLVLNQNYEPLNICSARRAVLLLYKGKAELLENGRGDLRAVSSTMPMPSVIRLMHMVKRPTTQLRFSRREIFSRDKYKCQYCGKETKNLTLDHVIPRHRGGPHVWENVTSACIPCNHRKAGRTPAEANMKLLSEPKAPRPYPYYAFQYRAILDEWRKFIPWVS